MTSARGYEDTTQQYTTIRIYASLPSMAGSCGCSLAGLASEKGIFRRTGARSDDVGPRQ